jgi:glycosyltransferase involved in cell wall biosynthesis
LVKVSVCIATFNGERYIYRQVDSILQQLGENDEIIVSDNGSSDSTLDILKSFKDKRIVLVHCSKRGVVKNFENAINHSTGDYLFLSDQDDVWLPGRLAEGMRLLENYDVASVGMEFIDGDGNLIDRPFFVPRGGLLKNIVTNNYPGCCLSFRRSCLTRILPFPKYIPMHDWWIVLVNLIFGDVGNSKGVFIQYRRHESNVSNTGGSSKNNLVKRLAWRLLMLIEVFKRYLVIKFSR